MPSALRIGRHPIGPGERTYIIAEAGVNHDGDLTEALRMVDAAADAGADACKFQAFRAAALCTAAAPLAEYQQAAGASSQLAMLAALELSDADYEALAQRCAARGIDFLATPFSPADVARVRQCGAPAIKLASPDLTNALLLDSAAATGLPILASTGAATADEIRWACARLRRHGATFALLHCVTLYPTPLADAQLAAISQKAQIGGVPGGYSDHTESVETGAWAVAAGACLLEKHFTLDRGRRGPDHAMSLEPEQLRAYVAAVRRFEAARGSGPPRPAAAEAPVRAVAGRSLVAAADMPAGTRLAPAHLAAKRPAGGIPPRDLDEVVGRVLRRALSADQQLCREDLA